MSSKDDLWLTRNTALWTRTARDDYHAYLVLAREAVENTYAAIKGHGIDVEMSDNEYDSRIPTVEDGLTDVTAAFHVTLEGTVFDASFRVRVQWDWNDASVGVQFPLLSGIPPKSQTKFARALLLTSLLAEHLEDLTNDFLTRLDECPTDPELKRDHDEKVAIRRDLRSQSWALRKITDKKGFPRRLAVIANGWVAKFVETPSLAGLAIEINANERRGIKRLASLFNIVGRGDARIVKLTPAGRRFIEAVRKVREIDS